MTVAKVALAAVLALAAGVVIENIKPSAASRSAQPATTIASKPGQAS